jgi:uncharacterized membrane protein
MILWGAFWGGVIAAVLGPEVGSFAVIGAAIGAVIGFSLRAAIRKEVAAQFAQQASAVATTPGAMDAPRSAATDEDAQASPGRPDPAAEVPPMPVDAGAVARPSAIASDDAGAPEAATGPRPWRVQAAATENIAWVGHAVDKAKAWLLGGNTIVRLGMLVLFVGLAFLAKYAADNSMLPPELRLAGIGCAGIALFVFGFRLRNRHPDKMAYALSLQGGGVAVLYLTVFAAFRLYQFLPSGAAFGVLAVICAFSTAIALMQNAMPMAFIGFAGAFAAPLLVSTGQGNHVGLFTYYLLLGVAIAAIAWLRAWRALNLLGFFATFGIATAWGALKFQPEQYASTQPFLIAFFLVYLVASLLYATRHALAPRQAVDATLIFGTPLVAFGLQAGLVRDFEYATGFSSLVLGGFYLALGYWALRRTRSDNGVGRWLAECFVALGLGFVTLAVPLALDPRWTSAVWAAEGAAVYWIGRRQERWVARATGLGLQVLGALAYLSTLDQVQAANWPFANPAFVGASLLAASAFVLAHWTRETLQDGGTRLAQWFARIEARVSPALFWIGFLWAQFALGQEISRYRIGAQGAIEPVLELGMQGKLHMLAWLTGAFLAHRLALPARARPWPIAGTPAWFNLPIMLLVALDGFVLGQHGFGHGGWWIWPLALVLHVRVLQQLDANAPRQLWSWIHSGGVWLLVLLFGNALLWAVQRAELFRTAWASVILLVSATGVLLLLAGRSGFDPDSRLRQRWPLQRFADAYLWRAAAPLAALVALAALAVAWHSNGDARPLPYVALLNPTDLSVALGLSACAIWWMRVRAAPFAPARMVRGPQVPLALIGLAFVAVNTVWLRVAHQYAGVRWDAGALFDSFLVQAGYSILWTLLALGLMVAAHRRQMRAMWMGGAVLLGATVLKLFLIDLSNRGGSERIVVFIAVGVLMLVVGYFAPLPPRPTSESAEGTERAPTLEDQA